CHDQQRARPHLGGSCGPRVQESGCPGLSLDARSWVNAAFILAFAELVKKQVDNGVSRAYSCSLRSQIISAFILRSAAHARASQLGHIFMGFWRVVKPTYHRL